MFIGNVEIKNRIILAPMAGITNIAFRKIIKQFGAGLVYSEMVSDKAILYGNKKTIEMLNVDESEHPISMQVFGGDLESIVEAAKYIDQNSNCDIIDINMGCPVNKVLKSDAGSKLLLYPDKIYEIVKATVEAVSKPVTVKIRIGFDFEHINCVEVAKLIEKAGASAIAIHGRTRSQMYEGKADWSWIKKVKEAVNIPVIGNGDVRTAKDAKRMIDETGVDAVMVGRAALGNPWVVKQMVAYVEDGIELEDPTYEDRIEQCLKHAQELIEFEGERLAIREMRGHAPWYIKGIKSSSYVKNKLSKIETYQELEEILTDYREYLMTNNKAIIEKWDKC
ncbi:MAG: tRNA dihydrouridine synthase DusB [Erysipelotrichaceae bacterium]|nr:tRNA dihydrouridine synthase DusB [Erysipelotrichaceae bacterium]